MRLNLGVQAWFAVLFALILATGLASVFGLSRMGTRIASRLESESSDQRAIIHMLAEATEQEKILAQLATAIATDAPRPRIPGNAVPTAADLGNLRRILGDSEQLAIVEQVTLHRTALQAKLDRLMPSGGRAMPQGVQDAVQASAELQNGLESLLLRDTATVSEAAARVERIANSFSLWIVCLTVATVLAALWLNHRISVGLLRPIGRFARLIDHAAMGDLDVRLPRQEDERLSSFALAVNRLIESLQRFADTGRRQLADERRIATALIESASTPALVANFAGDVLLANSSARLLLTGKEGDAAMEQLRTCIKAGDPSVTLGGVTYNVTTTEPAEPRSFTGHIVYLEAA